MIKFTKGLFFGNSTASKKEYISSLLVGGKLFKLVSTRARAICSSAMLRQRITLLPKECSTRDINATHGSTW